MFRYFRYFRLFRHPSSRYLNALVTLNLTMSAMQRIIAPLTNFMNALQAGESKAKGNHAPPLTAR